MHPTRLPLRHLLLALACVCAWGGNFVVIRLGLADLPPLLLAALRFGLVALLALALPRPPLPWRDLLVYGLLWGVLQFGCLFVAMAMGMPTGLTSVVAQSQAIFTLLFLAMAGHLRLRWLHAAVIVLAAGGITLLALDQAVPIPPLALAVGLAGAAGWAAGNLYARTFAERGVRIDSVAFVAWISVPAAFGLLLLSVANGDLAALHWPGAPALPSIAALLLYQALVAQLFGALAWNQLLRHHGPAVVAPYSLLVPVVGIALAWLLLGERPGPLQWAGSLLFLLALVLNSLVIRPATVTPGTSRA